MKSRFPGWGSRRELAVWVMEGAGPACLGLGAGWDLWVTIVCGGAGVTDLESRSCSVSIGVAGAGPRGRQSWRADKLCKGAGAPARGECSGQVPPPGLEGGGQTPTLSGFFAFSHWGILAEGAAPL